MKEKEKRNKNKRTCARGALLCVGQYGPRNRLLLRRGAYGSAQATHTRYLTGAWRNVAASVAFLLVKRLQNEGVRESLLLGGDIACQV